LKSGYRFIYRWIDVYWRITIIGLFLLSVSLAANIELSWGITEFQFTTVYGNREYLMRVLLLPLCGLSIDSSNLSLIAFFVLLLHIKLIFSTVTLSVLALPIL
jgi:hypothetical protein